jgi:hypothetical protein
MRFTRCVCCKGSACVEKCEVSRSGGEIRRIFVANQRQFSRFFPLLRHAFHASHLMSVYGTAIRFLGTASHFLNPDIAVVNRALYHTVNLSLRLG